MVPVVELEITILIRRMDKEGGEVKPELLSIELTAEASN